MIKVLFVLVVLLAIVFAVFAIGYAVGAKERPRQTKREKQLGHTLYEVMKLCMSYGDVESALSMQILDKIREEK
jgi:uncharacterized membrane protein